MSKAAWPAGFTDPAAPQPGLRERNKRLRLQRILSAAGQLFRQKGFAETTIQDIARAAGIGSGTLYLYAPGKEDLLVQVCRESLLESIDTAFEHIPPEGSLLDQLLAFFCAHLACHQKDIALARSVLKELSFPSTAQRRQEILCIQQAICARLGMLLSRAQARGQLAPALPLDSLASSILALYQHQLQGCLCGFFPEEGFRDNLRTTLQLLLPAAQAH